MRVLIIEDDIEICDMVRNFLADEAFEVETAHNGEEGSAAFSNAPFDIVLLDIMMPKLNGLDVMQNIRAVSTVPIIIMSAKDTDLDKSLGLGLGADDYITKPFSMTELLARIKANIRRSTLYSQDNSQSIMQTMSVGDILINFDDYSVYKHGNRIDLTAKEFEILRLLIENPMKVYTKAQIYASVWNDVYLGDENAVNVHISRLRTKIEDDPKTPKYIVTVWGIGYKLGDCHD